MRRAQIARPTLKLGTWLFVLGLLGAGAGGAQACTTHPECNDGNLCNGTETCSAGVCVAGTPPTCNDGNPCTTDSWVPATGGPATNVTNGTSCADANVCNGAEPCQNGVCTAGTPITCNDSNPCTTDSCDPVLGCQNVAVTNGTACSDGNACN